MDFSAFPLYDYILSAYTHQFHDIVSCFFCTLDQCGRINAFMISFELKERSWLESGSPIPL